MLSGWSGFVVSHPFDREKSEGWGALNRCPSPVPIDKEEGCVKHEIEQAYPDGA
jgi:hypothetical protein